MIIVQYFLIFILGLFYWLFTGEVIMLFSLFGFTLLGTIIFFIITNSKNKYSYLIYNWGILIYGLYMLLSHASCISNPTETFFIHNDAYGGFFTNTVLQFKDMSWNSIGDVLFVSSYCNEYPGSGVWFVALAKLADYIGVINLRFFLRMQSFLFGSCIIGMIGDLLFLYGYNKKNVYKSVFGFALFSYLIFSAVIFTRDIHVAFFYTCIGYIYLKPHCKNRILLLFIFALLSALPRPENGLFALLFPVVYLYVNSHTKYRSYALAFGVAIAASILLYDTFISQLDQIEYYHNRTIDVEKKNGLFMIFNNLPFPFNTTFVVVYSMIHPLPFDSYVYQGAENGGGWVAAPSIITPFYWSYFFIISVLLILKKRCMNSKAYFLLLTCLFYIFLTEFIDPNVRRTFAIYPTIFMVCILYGGLIAHKNRNNIKYYWWPILLLINIFSIMYLRF